MADFMTGRVSKTNPTTGTVRVIDTENPNFVTPELQVMYPAHGNQVYEGLPAEGDIVVICFPSNGNSDGFVMGSLATAKDMPAIKEKGVTAWRTRDGNNKIVKDDSGNLTVFLSGKGDITVGDVNILIKGAAAIEIDGTVQIKAPRVEIEAPRVEVEGDLVLTGNMGINGDLIVAGDIANTGDMTTDGTHTDSIGTHYGG